MSSSLGFGSGSFLSSGWIFGPHLTCYMVGSDWFHLVLGLILSSHRVGFFGTCPTRVGFIFCVIFWLGRFLELWVIFLPTFDLSHDHMLGWIGLFQVGRVGFVELGGS
jgi:hypothetical protein